VYDRGGKLVLAGEVKLPGTVEGRDPHNAALVQDAHLKASEAGAQFFFTWNVNRRFNHYCLVGTALGAESKNSSGMALTNIIDQWTIGPLWLVLL
jgi:hypothetical protein